MFLQIKSEKIRRSLLAKALKLAGTVSFFARKYTVGVSTVSCCTHVAGHFEYGECFFHPQPKIRIKRGEKILFSQVSPKCESLMKNYVGNGQLFNLEGFNS